MKARTQSSKASSLTNHRRIHLQTISRSQGFFRSACPLLQQWHLDSEIRKSRNWLAKVSWWSSAWVALFGIFGDVHIYQQLLLAASVCVCVWRKYTMQWYVGAWISLATLFKQAWIISHVKVAAHQIVSTTIDHEILGSSSAGPNCQAPHMGTALITRRGPEKHHPEKHIVKGYVQITMTCHG